MYEIFGPYQLIEKLASGGMAEIFKARTYGHSGFEKTLVIKRLHPRYTQTPEFVEMLKDEAKIAVGLSHANIVQIFDLGRVQEHYYIAMEYINGRDLNQLMNRVKDQRIQVPPEAALYITSEVCAGLDFAHRQRDPNGRLLRLIHRDVSPQNIMISLEGEVKIVDFGIAKSLASHQETEAGVIKGKFCFMSPEQARGQKLDHRTDIFSAGIMLYELLTGQPMYENSDDHQLLQQVRNAQFVPLESLRPDLPNSVYRVVNKALARDRDQRYPSARHLQHSLEKVMQKSGLMFSRFQLGQMFSNYFPHLKPIHDDILNTFDEFENDELSLITDYETQPVDRGDWEVPEFTDEIEELDIEELEAEEHTDPSGQFNHRHSSSVPFSRNATPVPVNHNHNNYAPAAPPPKQSHLYDPNYDPPKESTLGVAGHAQVTLPPQAFKSPINEQELYSGDRPSKGIGHSKGQVHSSDQFLDQVDSTMILDDDTAYPQRSGSNERSVNSRMRGVRQTKTSRSSAQIMDRLNQGISFLKGWANDPKGRYAFAILGFIIIFVFAQMTKKLLITPPNKVPIAVKLGDTSPGMNVRQSTSDVPFQTPSPNSMETRRSAIGQQQPPTARVIPRLSVNDGSTIPVSSIGQGMDRPARVNGIRTPNPVNLSGQPLPMVQTQEVETYPNEYNQRKQNNINSFQPPQKQMFSLKIITDPPQAEVAINDEWHPNMTPVSVQVAQGEMIWLTFSKEGYEEKREKVWPQVNNPTLTFNLQPHLGHLIINTKPEGVSITRNGREIGKTPYEREDFPLKPTEFRVELSKRGYVSKAYRMSWLNADRGILELDATLEKKERARPKVRAQSKRRKKRTRTRSRRPSGNGYVSVKASRWGHLFVDNRFVKEGKIVLKHRVSAGRHRVKFCFEGDRGNCAQKSISVSNGAHEKVFF